MERKIILSRHLATQFNRNGIIMGANIDAPIIKDRQVGEFTKKILLVREILDESTLDNIVFISSPLKRCEETTDIIKNVLNPSKQTHFLGWLTETDMGDFTGKTGHELKKQYGELVDQWMFTPETFCFPGGESYLQVKQRVKNGLKEILLKHENKTIIICTHVDIIKMIILEALGLSFNRRRYFEIPNGSVSTLSILKDDQLKVEGINQYPFLLG